MTPRQRTATGQRAISDLPVALALLLALSLALAACKREHGPDARADAAATAVTSATAPLASVPTRPRTTNGAIAVDNLGAEISALDKRGAEKGAREKLVRRLLSRATFLGGMDDYVRADREAKEAVKLAPKSAEAHLTLAASEAAVHRFARALEALDRAEKLGAPSERVAHKRLEIAIATGRYDEARRWPHDGGADPASASELTVRAVLAAHMQQPEASERLFEQARAAIRGVSPFLLAWMDVERAQVFESTGKTELARKYYAEANEALPQYVHATVHLATMESPARALALLRALPSQEDAEVLAALATAHTRAGDREAAAHAADLARAAYARALAAFPEAFADHAARFYLAQGTAAERATALALSREAAKTRRTAAALDLWMGAAAATDDATDLCASARALSSLRYLDAPRRALAEGAKKRCAP